MSIELKGKYYINHIKKIKESITSPFSLIGIHHAHLNNFFQNRVLSLPKGSRVLDGGCGISGWVTDEIRDTYDLYGMDCQIESVRLCYLYYNDSRYFSGDLYTLPFADNIMDAVVLREVIEHIKNPEKAVKEIKRVLKKNSRLLLTTPNYSNPLLWIIENTYNRFFSEIKPYLDDVHPSKFKFKQLRELLEQYFDVIEYGTIDCGLNIKAVAAC